MKRQSKAKKLQRPDAMDEESRGGFVPLDVSSPTAKRSSGDGAFDDDEAGRHPAKKRQNGLRDQLHSFRVMSSPYFRESREGKVLFAIMVVLTLANSAVRVTFSYLARDFWSALSDKDVEKFYSIMNKFVGAMILLAPINVFYRFQRQKLAIAWRKWMTGRVLRLYFSNKVYYGLERQCGIAKADDDGAAKNYHEQKKEVDNPDQRIAEDIRSFTEFSLSFFLTLVTSVIDLVCFSFILFSIMPKLFIAIFLFASIGTILTVLIGKVLIRLNYESLQKEADFRFSLVRVRENAESIAFYAGEPVEERETDRRFDLVIGNMTMINIAQRNLDFLTTSYNYLTWVLPIAVVAPEYFAGNVEMGVISQASSAFGHILDDLSLVVNSFTDVSKFSAGIDRLFSFLSAVRNLDPDRQTMESLLSIAEEKSQSTSETVTPIPLTSDAIQVKEYDPLLTSPATTPDILSIRSLCLATPDSKRWLVQNLDLTLPSGSNLLIVGASGAGKSSLLRAVAGLWNTGDGEITRPTSEHVYFLPQRPYCPPGSLRDQLLYPSTEHAHIMGSEHRPDGGPGANDGRRLWKDWTDGELLKTLERVDLPHLAGRSGNGDPYRGLNAVLDWSNTLSLGEQQRLAFARLLINRPKLVVMDESTSALDVVAEKKMYTLLKSFAGDESNAGLTYVSVGHRPTLLAHHDLKLSLRDGTGHISEIPPGTCAVDEGFILS
ncbi:hypothetical protein ACHAWF_013331 [Thalassiosira exigua]